MDVRATEHTIDKARLPEVQIQALLYDKEERESGKLNEILLTGYTTYAEEKTLPAIISVSIKGEVLWAYLDTGSTRNFIFSEAVKKLKLNQHVTSHSRYSK